MTTPFVCDALWRCLCPSFSQALLYRAAPVRRHASALAPLHRTEEHESHGQDDTVHTASTTSAVARQQRHRFINQKRPDQKQPRKGIKDHNGGNGNASADSRPGFGTRDGTKWGIQGSMAREQKRGQDSVVVRARPGHAQHLVSPRARDMNVSYNRRTSDLTLRPGGPSANDFDFTFPSFGPGSKATSLYSRLKHRAQRFDEHYKKEEQTSPVRAARYDQGVDASTPRPKRSTHDHIEISNLDMIQKYLDPSPATEIEDSTTQQDGGSTRNDAIALQEDGTAPTATPQEILSSRSINTMREDYRAEVQTCRVEGDLTVASTEQLYGILLKASNRACPLLVARAIYTLVHDRGEKPSLSIYNAQILSYAHPSYGSAAVAEAVFEEMRAENILPDSITYHNLLRVLAVHPDFLFRSRILQEMQTRWIDVIPDGWHSIAAGQMKELQIEMALSTYEDMRQRGIQIQSWLPAALLHQLCDLGELDAARNFLQVQSSLNNAASVSQTQWMAMLDAATAALHYPLVQAIWAREVVTRRIIIPTGQILGVLHTAARAGDPDMATKAYEMLVERSTPSSSYNTELLILAYANAGDVRTCFTILSVMQAAGYDPDDSVTRPMRRALLGMPDPSEAWAYLHDLRAEGRKIPLAAPHVILCAVLETGTNEGKAQAADDGIDNKRIIDDLIASSRSMQQAMTSVMNLYESMHTLVEPSTSTFDILLRGCREARRKDLALFLVAEMRARKLEPSELTYDRLILVCLNDRLDVEGSTDDAYRFWREMGSKGLTVRLGTVSALIWRLAERRDERIVEVLGRLEGEVGREGSRPLDGGVAEGGVEGEGGTAEGEGSAFVARLKSRLADRFPSLRLE